MYCWTWNVHLMYITCIAFYGLHHWHKATGDQNFQTKADGFDSQLQGWGSALFHRPKWLIPIIHTQFNAFWCSRLSERFHTTWPASTWGWLILDSSVCSCGKEYNKEYSIMVFFDAGGVGWWFVSQLQRWGWFILNLFAMGACNQGWYKPLLLWTHSPSVIAQSCS